MYSSHSFRAAALLIIMLMCTVGGHGLANDSFDPYIAMESPVVVNLASAQRARYLQLTVELRVETPADAAVVSHHMPVIRDTLILFFGGRTLEEIRPVENRESLHAEALESLRNAMHSRAGRPAVAGLYFTGFLIQ